MKEKGTILLIIIYFVWKIKKKQLRCILLCKLIKYYLMYMAKLLNYNNVTISLPNFTTDKNIKSLFSTFFRKKIKTYYINNIFPFACEVRPSLARSYFSAKPITFFRLTLRFHETRFLFFFSFSL